MLGYPAGGIKDADGIEFANQVSWAKKMILDYSGGGSMESPQFL